MKLKPPTEHQEQVNYFKIIEMHKTRYPQLKCISATQNGLFSHPNHVSRMKKAGLIPGYPDIIIDVSSRGYHGGRIELKRRNGGKGLSPTQCEWFAKLSDQGYWCHCAKGWEAAWAATCWYLEIKELRNGST